LELKIQVLPKPLFPPDVDVAAAVQGLHVAHESLHLGLRIIADDQDLAYIGQLGAGLNMMGD